MVCELAMYFYMDLNEEFVLDIYNGIETNTAKLK
jgi:hypothetical protein